METENFIVESSLIHGFFKEIRWKDEENSFLLAAGYCLIDYIFRFEAESEMKKVEHAFEYDLEENLKGNRMNDQLKTQIPRISDFSLLYKSLKSVEKRERPEKIYELFLTNQEFVTGLAAQLRVTLVKNALIKESVDQTNINKVQEYLYYRYKLVLVLYTNEKLFKPITKDQFALLCFVTCENGYKNLLTKVSYHNLDLSCTKLEFPYLWTANWEDFLRTQEKNLDSDNKELLKILTAALLKVQLSNEEETEVLECYDKSGLILRDLEILRLRSTLIEKPLTNFLQDEGKCDGCMKNSLAKPGIRCTDHTLCMKCRLYSFNSDFSSTCPYCSRELTPSELSLLSSSLLN